MQCPRAVLFDLDDTLAESFQPPKQEIVDKLLQLLDLIPVAIITGRNFARIEPGLLPLLTSSPHISQLYIFPESASECFTWDGSRWTEQYSFSITDEERARIRTAIEESVKETGILEGLPCFGEQFVEKQAQTAFAALGLQVPRDLKYSWDPGNIRRKALRESVAKKLPDFEVLLGGATSIDVTKSGVNKSYGVRWLVQKLDLPITEMLYIGDALYEGGNDSVVIPTGIPTRQVAHPEETSEVMSELIAACSA